MRKTSRVLRTIHGLYGQIVVRGREWQETSCKAFHNRFIIFMFNSKFYRKQLIKSLNHASNTYTHIFSGSVASMRKINWRVKFDTSAKTLP